MGKSPICIALGWSSQDARDNFLERSAIIQEGGATGEEADAEALKQLEQRACAWCDEPHAGGPEKCED